MRWRHGRGEALHNNYALHSNPVVGGDDRLGSRVCKGEDSWPHQTVRPPRRSPSPVANCGIESQPFKKTEPLRAPHPNCMGSFLVTLLSSSLSLASLKVVLLVALHNTLSATSCATILSLFGWRCHNTTPLKICVQKGTGKVTMGQLYPGSPRNN